MQVRTMFFTNKQHKKIKKPTTTSTNRPWPVDILGSKWIHHAWDSIPRPRMRFIGAWWFPKTRRSRIHKWSYTWGVCPYKWSYINEWPNWGEISPRNKWSYGHSTKITGDGVHFVTNKLKRHLPPQLGILRALFHAVLKPTESNSETNKNHPNRSRLPESS